MTMSDAERREMAELRKIAASFGDVEPHELKDTGPNVPRAGMEFGPYELEEPIGRGGSGEVWKAFRLDHPEGGTRIEVAVKIMRRRSELETSWEEELAALAEVKSTATVRVFESGEQFGRRWIATEFVEGPTIAKAAEDGPFDIGRWLVVAKKYLWGVAAIHDEGLLHLDLTAKNVILTREPDGELPRIIDLGSARRLRSSAPLGWVTPGYETSEYRLGGRPDERTDVCMAATTLYHALRGGPAFTKGRWPSSEPEQLGRDLPKELLDVLRAAMAWDPAERPDTVRELRTQIRAAAEKAFDDDPLTGRHTVGFWQRGRRLGHDDRASSYQATHSGMPNRRGRIDVLHGSHVDRAKREETCAALFDIVHPGVFRVLEYAQLDNGKPFVVWEAPRGQPLASVVNEQEPMAPRLALKRLDQVVDALGAHHRAGLCHGVLSPAMIYVANDQARLADMGASTLLGLPSPTDKDIAYRPQELLIGAAQPNPLVDVYGLAAVVYFMLAGRPPFRRSDRATLYTAVLSDPPDAASIAAPMLEVLHEAMAKAPGDRPQTVDDLWQRLTAAATEAGSESAGGPQRNSITQYINPRPMSLWNPTEQRTDRIAFMQPAGGWDRDSRPVLERELGPHDVLRIGKVAQRSDGTTNDIVLPHSTVSRLAATVSRRGGRAYLRRVETDNSGVLAGQVHLSPDGEAPLHHWSAITVGMVTGIFYDGRFTPGPVSVGAVDPETGLLGRDGLLTELVGRARKGAATAIRLGLAAGDAPEEEAVLGAMRTHEALPQVPVARFGPYVAAITESEAAADVALAPLGERFPQTTLRMDGGPSMVAARLAEACAALHEPSPDHKVRAEPLVSAEALAMFDGEVGLAALTRLPLLARMGAAAVEAMQLELVGVVRAAALRLGVGVKVSIVRPGVIGVGTASRLVEVLDRAATDWRSRAPISSGFAQFERGLTTMMLGPRPPRRLAEDAAILGGVGIADAVVARLPSYLGAGLRRVLEDDENGAAFVDFVGLIWKTLGTAVAGAHYRRGRGPLPHVSSWQRFATTVAKDLPRTKHRVDQLVGSLFDPEGSPAAELHEATDAARALRERPTPGLSARQLAQLARRVAQLLEPLEAWPLISIEALRSRGYERKYKVATVVEHFGALGTPVTQEVTVSAALPAFEISYLARIDEGIFLPLEPQLRWLTDDGEPELAFATHPVVTSGPVPYIGVRTGRKRSLEVLPRHLPGAASAD